MTKWNKNKKQKRKMRQSRLQAVKKIERTKPGHPTNDTRPIDMPTPVDPATQQQIQELRKLGLSVSTNASSEKLRSLLAEFNLVSQYVEDVLQAQAPNPDDLREVPPDQLSRFAAMLFGDGQLVDGIVTSQRARDALTLTPPILRNTTEFKQVSRLLRKQFVGILPKQPWWARLLGR